MASTNHDGPVAQLKLLHAVVLSGWSTNLDHKVAAVIISRYYPKYAGARASLRFIEEATGSTRANIIASIRRLVSHGAFSVKVEGKGTRPTEYNLNFDFPSGTARNTSPSGTAHNTSCGIADETSSDSSGIAHDTETYLRVPVYDTGIRVGSNISAPASPPHAHGLEASAAGSAEDGFEELWRAYGHRQKKADAKAAYRKAAPDTDMHRRMVEAARIWREAWAAQGRPDAPRYTLKKWIEREDFECDPPLPYRSKDKKPVTQRPGIQRPILPANSNVPPRPSAMTGEIVRADVRRGTLFLSLRDAAGAEREVKIVLESNSQAEQEAGQARFTELLQVVELDKINDIDELVGKRLHLTGGGRLKAA